MTTSPVITSEIQKLAPGAIIELFVLDTTNLNGDISYFHSGTNGLHQNIIWQGQEYTRYPVEASGFEYSGNGQLPRPKMKVSNAFGAITALILELGDMVGSKLIRKRTLKKCLDAINFEGGVNPDEDTSVEWPEEIYFVERKVSEGPEIVEFELAAAMDLQGVLVPKRQIIQNVCPFVYRGADCSYVGPPTFNSQDEAMTLAATSEGQALLDTYQLTLIKKQAWVDAIAATATAKQNQELACDYYKTIEVFEDPGGVYPPVNGVVINYLNQVFAFRDSVAVSLGATYRLGEQVGAYANRGGTTYKIQVWEVDTVECSAKTDLYDAAVIAQATALSEYETSLSNYAAAFAALPTNDPLYSLDTCGKRITSCKLRFGEGNPLSFGGFPSASLIK